MGSEKKGLNIQNHISFLRKVSEASMLSKSDTEFLCLHFVIIILSQWPLIQTYGRYKQFGILVALNLNKRNPIFL